MRRVERVRIRFLYRHACLEVFDGDGGSKGLIIFGQMS